MGKSLLSEPLVVGWIIDPSSSFFHGSYINMFCVTIIDYLRVGNSIKKRGLFSTQFCKFKSQYLMNVFLPTESQDGSEHHMAKPTMCVCVCPSVHPSICLSFGLLLIKVQVSSHGASTLMMLSNFNHLPEPPLLYTTVKLNFHSLNASQ
jgi:hypothetical protein